MVNKLHFHNAQRIMTTIYTHEDPYTFISLLKKEMFSVHCLNTIYLSAKLRMHIYRLNSLARALPGQKSRKKFFDTTMLFVMLGNQNGCKASVLCYDLPWLLHLVLAGIHY